MEQSFLFTDIENSTSLWEVHPEDMLAALEWHDAAIGDIVDAHDGELVKSTGDGALAAFKYAKPALEAAVAIQHAMDSRAFGEVGRLRVRVGIHRGSAARVSGDYLGSAVNRAARVMSAGAGGQILVSAEALENVDVFDEFTPEDLGHHRLRGVRESLSLFQLNAAGLKNDFPPPKTEPAVHNLRSYPSSFVGRRRERQRVVESLEQSRLVSLVGPGGCGKTRLAVEIARSTLDRRRAGTWFVDLSASTSDIDVLDAFLTGTAVHVREGQDPLQALQQRFQDTDALVVVDNCEHVNERARAVIEELLEARGVRVLATSRTSLGSPAEVVQRVAPLDVSAASATTWSEAAELFVDRSIQMGSSPDVFANQRLEVEHLCRDLDGIPLALELAASRTRVLEVADLRQRLGQRLKLLKGSSSSVPRHQTLQAAVEWSFGLLDAESRDSMYRLAVFNGGFELDAAAAVLGFDELDTIDLLDGLIDQSLLQVDREVSPARFTMLETMRQYGHSQLEATNGLEDVHAAHRHWMIALAAKAEPLHMTNDGPPAHDRLDREFPNLRSAMASALEERPEDAARLAADLGLYFWLRGHLSEGLRYCNQGLQGCPPNQVGLQARIHLALGELYFGLLRLEESVDALARAHQMALDAGDRPTAGWASMFLATCHATTGHIELALEHRDFALEVADADVTPNVRAGAYYYVGLVNLVLGEAEAAAEYLDRSVVLAREVGSPYTLTRFLPVVARQAYSEGQEADAIELFGEALELARRTNDPIGEARCLVYLSEIELKRTHHDQVELHLAAARPIVHTRIDDRALAIKVELGLAAMYRQMGRLPEAEAHVGLARQAVRDLGSWRPSTDVDLAAALVATDLGDHGRAVRDIGRSLTAAREAQHDEWMFSSTAHALRLNILPPTLSVDKAMGLLNELFRSIHRPELRALGWQALGLGLLRLGDHVEAEQQLMLAVEEYRRLGHRLAAVEAAEELGHTQALGRRSAGDYGNVLERLRTQRRELGCPLSAPRAIWLQAPFQGVSSG